MDFDIKVLVVDDFATMRRIIKGSLNQLGFTNIIEADDGGTALTKLKKEDINLIISDCNMPNMSGLELLKAVRGDEKLRDITFIMVTGEDKRDKVLEVVKAGASDYIVKPFTPGALGKKLERLFAN